MYNEVHHQGDREAGRAPDQTQCRSDAVLGIIFAGGHAAEPSPPAKLDSTTEAALAQSLGRLSLGKPGWITMQEGRRLFSPMDDLYAFGEMDEVGRNNLTRFGTQNDVRLDIMPAEGRIYFSRSAR